MKSKLTERSAKPLLIFVVAARGTSFCFSKLCLQTLSPFMLLGIRFTLAFLLLCLIFHKSLTETLCMSDIKKGMLFGSIYFLVMVCEYTGLRTSNSSTASFIENMAIVIVPIVPLLNISITHRFPSLKDIIRAILACIGVGLLTLTQNGFSISTGELILICAAFFYAAAILVTNKLSKIGNSLNMGIFQVGTIGILGFLTSIVGGTVALPSTPEIYAYIVILAVVCTGFGYTLQPVAQSKLSAETTSVCCAINPLVASLIGMLFLHEIPSFVNIIGEILIIIVLLIP